MAKFADYGFNKSHAAAYALVAYQTAWMKANHPVAFIAACMSLAIGNTDKLAALRQEAARMGIAVLPPDINRSGADFRVERMEEGRLAIRYALAAVKKVGFAAMASGGAARGERPFADLGRFRRARRSRGQLNRMQIENLVRAGAFDRMDENRAQAVRRRGDDPAARAGAGGGEGQRADRRCSAGGKQPEPLRLPEMPDWPPMERLAFEAEAVGFHLTAHPLDAYAPALRRLGVVASDQVEARARGGVGAGEAGRGVVATKERITRTGSRMAWVRLSDAAGSFEVTLFSEVLARCREHARAGAIRAGDSRSADGGRDAAHHRAGCRRRWTRRRPGRGRACGSGCERTEAVPHIRDLLAREGAGGAGWCWCRGWTGRRMWRSRCPGGFNVSPRLAQAMKLVPGVQRVEEIE